ncbi:carbohydrate ABC transporter permease [Streptomyces sp. NPDC020766]|uniref:carbohydrate ABC transporter permease n=1 Tax=Streptomyces sp. NPDC020766 TaxID=3155011 RepID=UPI0033EF33D9
MSGRSHEQNPPEPPEHEESPPDAAMRSHSKAAPERLPAAIRRSLPRAAWWVVCASLAALFLYPLYVMIAHSLKTPIEATAAPPTLYPHDLSLDHYRALAGDGGIDVLTNVRNSLVVSLGTTLATVVLSILAGYGFARLRFPGSNLLFFAALVTFMVPFQALITPLYLLLKHLGLLNSLLGLILVYTTFQLPFGLFLMRNSFAAVPRSLEEAARIDGCGTLQTLVRVMLPVAVPGVIATGLLAFFTAWNEFFAALILVTDQERFTLPVSLSVISSEALGSVNWGVLQAGVTVTVIPCVIIYVLLQKYYVGGLLSTLGK